MNNDLASLESPELESLYQITEDSDTRQDILDILYRRGWRF